MRQKVIGQGWMDSNIKMKNENETLKICDINDIKIINITNATLIFFF